MCRDRAHLVEAAEVACECHSDLAVHKAANTEAYQQMMTHSHMWTYTNTFLLKGLQKVNDYSSATNQVISAGLLLPFNYFVSESGNVDTYKV